MSSGNNQTFVSVNLSDIKNIYNNLKQYIEFNDSTQKSDQLESIEIKYNGSEQNQQNFSAILSRLNTIQEYSNFNAVTHYETKKQLPTGIDSGDAFKFTVNFDYNFFSKKYEQILTDKSIIKNEKDIINFYSIFIGNNNNFKSISQIFLKSDTIKDYILNYNNQNSIIYYNSRIQDKNLNKFLSDCNSSKYLFPFYSNIFFSNSSFKSYESSLANIIDKNNLFEDIFNTYHTKKSLKQIGNENLNFYDLDPFFINKPCINEIMNYLQENKITLDQILNNNFCKSEVIGYKLSKYDQFGPSPIAIQEWYIPNTNKENTEFIDSQIYYDKKYKYTLSILSAVVVAKLSKPNNNTNNIYNIENSIYLYEIDSATYANRLLDSPPIKPEVDFIPYIGIDNKIKINLNSAIGKQIERPIYLTIEENNQIEKIKESQDSIDKIIYQSNGDEFDNYFEVSRLEYEPKTFLEFINGQKTIISSDSLSSVCFEDNIKPNKKYYYSFRIFDYHGNFSNLTDIYVLEMINNSGVIYPDVQIYNFENFKDEQLEIQSRKFKKLVYIAPSYENKYIDSEDPNILNESSKTRLKQNIKVGLMQDPVWGKKFKIRLTSLSSGKKIDINFVFKVNRD